MKKSIVVKKSFKLKGFEIEVGVVSNKNHAKSYEVIQLNEPMNTGLIGVNNGEEFALKFKPNKDIRIAFAVYLDGVNVDQSGDVINVKNIPKEEQSKLESHSYFFSSEAASGSVILDRYNQKNKENRTFTFTTAHGGGINEVLIQDSSLANRIEIFLWMEYFSSYDFVDQDCDDLPFGVIHEMLPGSEDLNPKIGAGKATNKEYTTGKGIDSSVFLGKINFIYLDAKSISPLKNIIANLEPDNIIDPMDNVPKT